MSTPQMIRAFFILMDQDRLDERLENLLNRMLLKSYIEEDKLKLLFKNDILAEISHSFDGFKLKLSDPSFYDSGDSENKLISDDRIRYYLKSLANYKYQ